jgi:hypothetical protein
MNIHDTDVTVTLLTDISHTDLVLDYSVIT